MSHFVNDQLDPVFGLGKNEKHFVNFVKINTEGLSDDQASQKEIEFLAKRIAENMFYYKQNINTAKTDYLYLISMLIKKGIIFPEIKDQPIDKDYNFTK